MFFYSRNVSLAIRSEEDLDASTFDLRDGSTSKKERKASAATARFTIYKANKASKKKREKSSAKRERKATKTLAIVLGELLLRTFRFFTCCIRCRSLKFTVYIHFFLMTCTISLMRRQYALSTKTMCGNQI